MTSVESEIKNQAAGCEGQCLQVRCENRAQREKPDLPENHENCCEKVVVDGLGPRESMVRSSRWHRSYRRIVIKEADGSCSRQEGNGVAHSLVREVNILEGEEELSIKWRRLLRRSQVGKRAAVVGKEIFEVQTWRQLR